MKKTLVPVTALALAMASATWAVMQALTLPQTRWLSRHPRQGESPVRHPSLLPE